MDPLLLDIYPLAQKAFAWHDDFYARHVSTAMPTPLKAARERVAEIIDGHIDRPIPVKDAMIVVALISLDPLPCHKLYGDPAYGKEVDALMNELIVAAKYPEAPLSKRLAPVITAISVAMMEQVMAEIAEGSRDVNAAELKGGMHRAALNDSIYLPNLNNKKLQDLYETTQFAYFSALERATLRVKKPPAPPNPGGPVF
jgi:hypothetical protein